MKYITIILSIIIVVLIYSLIKSNNVINDNSNYIKQLSNSLNLTIHNQDSIINKFKQDTINHTKIVKVINTKYEKIYIEYSNPDIISDDSITNFISSKIHN